MGAGRYRDTSRAGLHGFDSCVGAGEKAAKPSRHELGFVVKRIGGLKLRPTLERHRPGLTPQATNYRLCGCPRPRPAQVNRTMFDLIKKTLLAGVGAAVITKEKVEDSLDDYVRQGKLKADDAKIIASKIAEQGRKEFEEMSQTLAAKIQDLAANSTAKPDPRIAALEERIRSLEAKLANPPTRAGEP
jgi:polyhydroxyalkanoate synthesis regulator phasin